MVLIYIESFENIFSDKEIFGEDLIRDLDINKLNGKSFKKFKETAYTNWTIAGIVASQCGLPPKPITILNTKNKGRHNKFGFGLKTFLPNAKCLGDILKENDYKNIFINAVSLDFVGTGLFLKIMAIMKYMVKKNMKIYQYLLNLDHGVTLLMIALY